MNNIKYTILIPCLNEQETISRVLIDAKENSNKYLNSKYEILVADNGSTDKTLNIIKKHKGVRFVNVPIRGYGAALHCGILSAYGDYIIFADADMSYPFSNLQYFVKTSSTNADLVLGSRFKGKIQKKSMPFLHRYFGTPILTLLINLIYKTKISDCNSGMRMIKKSFYKKLNMTSSGMEWASELLLKTSLKKGLYIEVPITFIKDKRIRSPHLNTWSDGWRHLKAIILLKPQSLYLILTIFALLAIIFYPINFALTFLFADLFVVLLLSLFVLDLLSSVINKEETKITKFLLKFKFVQITSVISIFVGIFIILIPESRLGTKLFFVSILGIIFMWIFFIETIKTHLVNKLPDEK